MSSGTMIASLSPAKTVVSNGNTNTQTSPSSLVHSKKTKDNCKDKNCKDKNKQCPPPKRKVALWRKFLDFLASAFLYTTLGITVFRGGARPGIVEKKEGFFSFLDPILDPVKESGQKIGDRITARKQVWENLSEELKQEQGFDKFISEHGDKKPFFDREGNTVSLKEILNAVKDKNKDKLEEFTANKVLKEKQLKQITEDITEAKIIERVLDWMLEGKRSESDKVFWEICRDYKVYEKLEKQNKLQAKSVELLHQYPRRIAFALIMFISYLRMFLTNALNPSAILMTAICNLFCFLFYGMNEISLESMHSIKNFLERIGIKLNIAEISKIFSKTGDFLAQFSKVTGSAARKYEGNFAQDLIRDPACPISQTLLPAASIRIVRNIVEIPIGSDSSVANIGELIVHSILKSSIKYSVKSAFQEHHIKSRFNNIQPFFRKTISQAQDKQDQEKQSLTAVSTLA